MLVLMAAHVIISCKKEANNIYNMFDDVQVTFHNNSPFSITDTKEISEGDSVYIDYTINSAKEDMAAVCVKREGQETPVLQINLPEGANKRSYSGTYKIAGTRVGPNRYRIYALNRQAVYIGDGYKAVEFNVKPNFSFTTERKVYLPDSVSTSLESYYSIKLAQSVSYENGRSVSADIDFGVYRTPATLNDANAIDGYWYHIYSLSASPLFFNIYNLTGWTKRATLFSLPANDANAFRDNLVSGVTVRTVASTKTINLTQTPRTSAGTIKVGSVIYYKNPEGKFGAIYVKQISSDYQGRRYFTINVKSEN